MTPTRNKPQVRRPLFAASFLALAVLLSLAACQPSGPESADLKVLQETRDSLKTVMSTLGAELQEIEGQIAALEGTDNTLQVTSFATTASAFNHYFSVQGNVETEKNAQLFPETQGVVKSIEAREGQRVSQGQTILTLDTELIRRNIQEVQTQYELAADIYERQARLWEQKIGSEVQLLEAKANKERLENTLSTLNKQVSMGSVKAPFSGIVDNIAPKIGEMASPAMPVARIISLENMYVKAQVSEHYVNVVEPGMPAEVVLPGDDTLAVAIDRVGRFINPENRTFEVSVKLDETERVRPNMYCALRINDLSLDSVVVIPTAMVQQDTENREFVFVLEPAGDKHLVRKQVIETGASYGDHSWIKSGLRPGMRIVDKGARRVNEGQEVAIFGAN